MFSVCRNGRFHLKRRIRCDLVEVVGHSVTELPLMTIKKRDANKIALGFYTNARNLNAISNDLRNVRNGKILACMISAIPKLLRRNVTQEMELEINLVPR